jgi:hypothetical protein
MRAAINMHVGAILLHGTNAWARVRSHGRRTGGLFVQAPPTDPPRFAVWALPYLQLGTPDFCPSGATVDVRQAMVLSPQPPATVGGTF